LPIARVIIGRGRFLEEIVTYREALPADGVAN
jgi:hypothetical protein